MLDSDKEVRDLKRRLRALTLSVMEFLRLLDAEAKRINEQSHGQRLAELANSLEVANDQARYFGLNIPYRGDRKDDLERAEQARVDDHALAIEAFRLAEELATVLRLGYDAGAAIRLRAIHANLFPDEAAEFQRMNEGS